MSGHGVSLGLVGRFGQRDELDGGLGQLNNSTGFVHPLHHVEDSLTTTLGTTDKLVNVERCTLENLLGDIRSTAGVVGWVGFVQVDRLQEIISVDQGVGLGRLGWLRVDHLNDWLLTLLTLLGGRSDAIDDVENLIDRTFDNEGVLRSGLIGELHDE